MAPLAMQPAPALALCTTARAVRSVLYPRILFLLRIGHSQSRLWRESIWFVDGRWSESSSRVRNARDVFGEEMFGERDVRRSEMPFPSPLPEGRKGMLPGTPCHWRGLARIVSFRRAKREIGQERARPHTCPQRGLRRMNSSEQRLCDSRVLAIGAHAACASGLAHALGS